MTLVADNSVQNLFLDLWRSKHPTALATHTGTLTTLTDEEDGEEEGEEEVDKRRVSVGNRKVHEEGEEGEEGEETDVGDNFNRISSIARSKISNEYLSSAKVKYFHVADNNI